MTVLEYLFVATSVAVCALLLTTILLIRADNTRRDREWREYLASKGEAI